MPSLVDEIAAAFADRAYPGDDNITRCGYDRRNGGVYDAPCPDCSRMAEFFRGRSWRELRPVELRKHGYTAGLFTTSAYCYFLPAFLIGMLQDRDAMDVCWDHLEFHFGPKPGDPHAQGRLAEILGSLTDAELRVLLRFFRQLPDQGSDDLVRAVANLDRAIAGRAGSGGSPGQAG